jgi:predicted DNA-binding transcriptional regulator YafY
VAVGYYETVRIIAAWCELRGDFRDFRIDRIRETRVLDEPFEDEPGKTLRDLLTRYGPHAVSLLDT